MTKLQLIINMDEELLKFELLKLEERQKRLLNQFGFSLLDEIRKEFKELKKEIKNGKN